MGALRRGACIEGEGIKRRALLELQKHKYRNVYQEQEMTRFVLCLKWKNQLADKKTGS